MTERDSSSSSGDSGSGDRGGDLYSSDFGDVTGGSVELDKDGSGKDHTSVHGDGGHFSWDRDTRTGEVSNVHGSIHGDKDRDKGRW